MSLKGITALMIAWGLMSSPPTQAGSVELHAHLFMKEGMTWAFTGDFNGPLRARSWRDLFRSQANPESLEQSGIHIVVACLYVNPFFSLSMRDSIRRQAHLAWDFVKTHPNWVVARNASEARQALAQDKRVMILALEGAAGILENETDLHEFVDQLGIRIVTLLHLTDDEYGGVAFLPGFRVLSDPWAWFRQVWDPEMDALGVRVNRNGLTPEGRAFAEALIRRGVWIDLAHASDRSARELWEISRARKLPLLYTHTVLRKYLHAERGINSEALTAVKNSEGIIGVMPSEDMLEGTQVSPLFCPASCHEPCEGSLEALATQYTEMVQAVGADSVMMGSDFNGGIPHLKPTNCPAPAAFPAPTRGYWNIAQASELWPALEKRGAPVPRPLDLTVEKFLRAWARVAP